MQWRHVVTAWDGSPASTAAARCAEKIAEGLGCRYSVLVVDGSGPMPVSGCLIPFSGIPAIEVPRWADAHGGDVIVLPGGPEFYAQYAAMIRRSAIPCLVVPSWQRRCNFLHIALDRTERGLQVLAPSRTAADSLSARVDYVCVTRAGDEMAAEAWLRDRAGIPADCMTVLAGAPVPTLAAVMAHSHEGVLVLGVRQGRSGSVPESSGVGRSLLRTADCAFLTVPL